MATTMDMGLKLSRLGDPSSSNVVQNDKAITQRMTCSRDPQVNYNAFKLCINNLTGECYITLWVSLYDIYT